MFIVGSTLESLPRLARVDVQLVTNMNFSCEHFERHLILSSEFCALFAHYNCFFTCYFAFPFHCHVPSEC